MKECAEVLGRLLRGMAQVGWKTLDVRADHLYFLILPGRKHRQGRDRLGAPFSLLNSLPCGPRVWHRYPGDCLSLTSIGVYLPLSPAHIA